MKKQVKEKKLESLYKTPEIESQKVCKRKSN